MRLRLAVIPVDDLTVPRLYWDARALEGSVPAEDGKSRCQWMSIVSSHASSLARGKSIAANEELQPARHERTRMLLLPIKRYLSH